MNIRKGLLRLMSASENSNEEREDVTAKLAALDRSMAVIEFTPDGTIKSANENFLGAMGYSLPEIAGQHHKMFMPKGEAEKPGYRQFWAELKQGQFQSGEYARVGKSGDLIFIQASYNPVINAQGIVTKVVKFASDITAQKQLEAENAARIEAIEKTAATIEFNMDGTIVTANHLFLQTMGYELDDIQGQHHRMFVLPEYGNSAKYAEFWNKLRNGQAHSAEFHRIGKGGKDVWIQATYNPILDIEGRPFKVIKIASDVTEQKKVNSEYQGQIEAIDKSQAVISFNLDGTIINANDNFLGAVGYRLEEINGQHHRMFVAPEEANSAQYRQFWESLRAGHFQSGEYKRINKNGEEVWIQASYNPILDAAGRPVKVVKYATDITEQKQRSADYEGQISAIGKSQAVIEFNMDGTIIQANDNFLGAMGYTLEEIQGQHHSMFATTAIKQSGEYREFWQRLNRGEFFSGEFQRVGKHGKDVWIQASYNPIFNASGKPFKVVKYASDITAQKQQSADYQGQIAAISKSQAVIEFNMDGTIRVANENFLSAMGYVLEEVQGKHHRMFAQSTLKHSLEYKQFWEKLNRGEYIAGQFKRVGKNGNEVWINASYNPILGTDGKPFKVVKYATDITEQTLKNTDYQGQIAAISKSQAMIAFNLDGTIIDANDNFLAALGYQLHDIQGRHHHMFVATDERESEAYRQFWQQLNEGEFQAGEYRRIGKGGKEIWIQATYNPIMDANGKPFKVVKYASDVTGRIKAVESAKNAVLRLSEGDLSASITEEFIPEFKGLKTAINETISRLRDMVRTIMSAASEVSTGATEIERGNNELNGRTERQASSLEETATSMEQLTSTVQNNANNSHLANEYSVDATQKAEGGGKIVRSAVDSMGAISDSSKRIYDIIGVIDELAFQTNLLALNAAVEAARAGEHGRGFAVVATEVRSLAQRSAAAAKEIKDLIKDSVNKVEDGTRLVNQSGETLDEIVSAIRKVSEMIASIDTSSSEQASGIGEINRAVSEMESMTQQNAALVEQASAASEALSTEAAAMTQQLSFFKL